MSRLATSIGKRSTFRYTAAVEILSRPLALVWGSAYVL